LWQCRCAIKPSSGRSCASLLAQQPPASFARCTAFLRLLQQQQQQQQQQVVVVVMVMTVLIAEVAAVGMSWAAGATAGLIWKWQCTRWVCSRCFCFVARLAAVCAKL
jgi:hypothetical protein